MGWDKLPSWVDNELTTEIDKAISIHKRVTAVNLFWAIREQIGGGAEMERRQWDQDTVRRTARALRNAGKIDWNAVAFE